MIKSEQIFPLFDRVLLRMEIEQQSNAGVYIPRDSNERSQIMSVVAAGETTQVKVGYKVIVAKYAGTELSIMGEKFFIVKECDILAVLR